MKQALMEVKKIKCGYESGFYIRDVSLNVYPGDFIGIIGPNGSGKSTLIRAISRILKPDRGRIFLKGNDIWEMDIKEVAKKVAVVSQNLEANNITVKEMVLLGRIPYFLPFQFLESSIDEKIAAEAIEIMGISKLKDKRLDEISGGERQLTHIARALAQKPEILLLDEPTSHLDIRHQISILDLMKRLSRDNGIAIVAVLHDLNLATEYCGRIVLMDKGKIYKSGSPEEVLDYKIIEEVYKTPVIVHKSPISGKPYVFPVTEEMWKRHVDRGIMMAIERKKGLK